MVVITTMKRIVGRSMGMVTYRKACQRPAPSIAAASLVALLLLPGATWAEYARIVGAVGLGNLVGGGLLVGAAYVVAAGRSLPAIPQGQTAANGTTVGEPVATVLR